MSNAHTLIKGRESQLGEADWMKPIEENDNRKTNP